MATEEVQAPAVEEQVADPAPLDPTGESEAPAAIKEEKPKKPRKPPASHPPYIEMIQEAITSLKEKTGSSQYAITKFIEQKHKDHIPPNFKKLLLFHLRKLTAAGKLNKVKNSYKIPATSAKPVKSKETSKRKPNVAVAKPKAKPSIKPKAKAVVKPNTKSTVSSKPKAKAVPAKPKTKSISKLKPVARVAKPKPKTLAAKPTARPAKAAKTSEKDAPGKKKVPATKALEKAKRAKATAKVTAKKTPASKRIE